MGAVLPCARQAPVLAQAVQVDAPPVLYVPTGHARPVVIMMTADTADAYETLSVYVPAPPAPVPSAAMIVPDATPAKAST